MKKMMIVTLLISFSCYLGACKKSETSGPSQNNPPPNNPTPEEPPKPPVRPDPPQINAITSGPKTYKSGDGVEFVVTFSQSVTVSEGHSPFLSLTVGDQPRQANFERGENGREGSNLFFIYEVEEGDNDDDGMTLASDEINLNGASIKDSSSQDLLNTIPQEYHNFPEVKVEAILPIMEGIAKASSVGSVVEENDIVDLVVTFSEPVKVTGNPSLILEVTGPSAASADYQNTGGSPTYSPTHTFRYTVSQGQEGSVQVTSLTFDASNFISDEAGNNVSSNIQAPFLVAELTISAGDCVGTDTDADTGFNGGAGSASSPYLICTYAQLNKMRDNLTAHYKLGQSINANDSWSVGADGCTAYDGSTVPTTDACTGWVPVGTYRTNKCDGGADDVCFQGHLDGAGYVISNLYINISSTYAVYSGLFGWTGNNAKISHVGLVDVNIGLIVTGNLVSNNYGGGLVGNNTGTISNSHVITVDITSSNTSLAFSYGGGLVGNNTGTISNSYAIVGTVEASSSSSSHPAYSGGITGSNDGTISNSYAIIGTTVKGSSNSFSYTGGLVGNNSGTISNSYAIGGTVEASSSSSNSSNSGGLTGLNFGTISNSYATGAVTAESTGGGTANGGGLVGNNLNDQPFTGTITRTNYFVDESGTNGLGSGTCSGTCEKKTLAELQALTSVTDWSADNWDFGTTTQLPRLKYAPTATYCTDDTHTTQQACEDASESWVIEGCGGDTGVTCGDVISGQ